MSIHSYGLPQSNPIIYKIMDEKTETPNSSKTDSIKIRMNASEKREYIKHFVATPAYRTNSILYYECLIGLNKAFLERVGPR